MLGYYYLHYGYLLSFVITIFLSLGLVAFTKKTKILLDHPEERKNHLKPVPLVGGIVLFIMTFYLRGLRLSSIDSYVFIIVFIIGFIDDLIEIQYYIKLSLQFIAGFIFISSYHFTLTGNYPLDSLFTFVFFVAILNAFNLIDGINGLLIGLSIIYFSFTLNFEVLPVLFGLFVLNITNNLFMGDTGAFLIAYLLITSKSIPMEIDKLVIFFGYPIYEIASSFLRRLVFRKNPFKPDRYHLHHIGTQLFGHTFFLIIAFSLSTGFLLLSSKEFRLFAYIIICLLLFFFQLNIISRFNNFKSTPERDDSNLEL